MSILSIPLLLLIVCAFIPILLSNHSLNEWLVILLLFFLLCYFLYRILLVSISILFEKCSICDEISKENLDEYLMCKSCNREVKIKKIVK